MLYFDNKIGHADQKAVQTLSKEVSRIISEQVKKSISENGEKKKQEVRK